MTAPEVFARREERRTGDPRGRVPARRVRRCKLCPRRITAEQAAMFHSYCADCHQALQHLPE